MPDLTLEGPPDDVLRTHIFQFAALQKENEFLRSEVARLRRIATRPYYDGAVALVGQHSAQGYGGVDIIDQDAARASADFDERRGLSHTTFIGAQIAQLTYEDKVSIIPALTKRGFCVSQMVNQDGDPRYPPFGVIPGHHANMCPLALAFKYQWDESDKRNQAEYGPLGNGAWGPAHSPPPPRFAVGTAVECRCQEGWLPGEVVQIGWPVALGDMGPLAPDGGYDFICPYQVKLESGGLIMAQHDTDKLIRLRRPNPLAPAAHGILKAVKDLGVSDDKLLDTALRAVDKIADACEVKDADFDEMFDC